MKIKRSGFTLLELMIVVACLMLLLIPAWKIFQHGTRSSLQGMLQIETTLEARRILRQVGNDLKQGCWAWNDASFGYYTAERMLTKSGTSFPDISYSFLSFPHVGDISSVVPASAKPNRKVSRITYKLEPSPKIKKENYPVGFPIYSLVREELLNKNNSEAGRFKDHTIRHVLSDRVMMFDISAVSISDSPSSSLKTTTQQAFWITLQLIDTLKRSGKITLPTSGIRLTDRNKDVVVADFFDIVAPQYLVSYRQMAGPQLGMASDYSRSPYFDPIDPEKDP